ncbi:unnamed protein product [Calicophoron daubneyi]|uniref:Phospholipid-transporting ATPase n=1 Tax=Calicophoron daubneyi TaxID=300641 RepID=A0AAV2T6E2_CALDB
MGKLKCRCLRRRTIRPTRTLYANQGPYSLLSGDDEPSEEFCDNAVVTSRYTWYNFFFKNIFEQYHSIATMFFTIIAIMYAFASSATSIWANLAPLIVVVVISMIKDGVEDIMRHRRDRVLNHALFKVLDVNNLNRQFRWVNKQAMKIRVGDVVYCENESAFPCDLVILASSNPNTEVNVTTVNLDGETNIKKYFSMPATQSVYGKYSSTKDLEEGSVSFDLLAEELFVKINCQGPTADLTRFEGRLSTRRAGEVNLPLGVYNLVLRGAKLRCTEYMIGVAVYTGRETKLSLNSKAAKRKYSSRESLSNIILLGFVAGMFVLSVLFAIGYEVWTAKYQAHMWYVPTVHQNAWEFVQNVFRFVFTFSYLIPISIIITMELEQTLIAYFISNDLELYSAAEDLRSHANSVQLADELGQVDFLFSDKTGTLTQNVMCLRLSAVLETNKIYRFDEENSTSLRRGNGGMDNEGFSSSESEAESENSGEYDAISHGFHTSKEGQQRFRPDGDDALTRFLIMVALCHTVDIPDQGLELEESTVVGPPNGKYIYEVCTRSSGPVRGLAMQHVTGFAVEGLRTLVYSTRNLEERKYRELLEQFRHTSGLVGEERAQALKAAYRAIESELTPVCVTGVEDKLQPGVKECLQSLREAGIQIWVLTGDKEETAITVSQAAGHFPPQMSLVRLTGCDTFEKTARTLFEQLEGAQSRNDLKQRKKSHLRPHHSLNVTPDEIEDIVYTAAGHGEEEEDDQIEVEAGDKPVDERDLESLRNLRDHLYSLTTPHGQGRVKGRKTHRRRHRKKPGCAGEPVGLVVDGKTLSFLLHPALRDGFLDLCMNVTTVLCCRMTPLQKASVVQLVQVGLNGAFLSHMPPVTAAVGDGGNDVAMLLQASIGIGIFGKEGREAARAGDYSIPQFRCLKRLFLVHGHWSYHRLTFTMNLFYFKCTALVATQVIYTFYCGYSQMVTFTGVLFAAFNLTMTSVECLLYGWFEKHLPDKILMERPYLYRVIANQANLRAWYVTLWVVEGIWQALVIYYVDYLVILGGSTYGPAIYYKAGSKTDMYSMNDLYLFGTAMYVTLWVCVNLRIAILVRDMNVALFIGYLITLLNVALMFIYQAIMDYSSQIINNFTILFLSPSFWFSLALAVVIANLPALIWRLISDTWWNVQIYLSYIPQSGVRKKERRSPRLWLTAMSIGGRDMRPEHSTNLVQSGSNESTATAVVRAF